MATSDYPVVSFDDSDTRRDEMHSTIEQWIDDLVDSVDDAQASAEFQAWLDVQRQFHDYSYRNTLLVTQQCPEASRVAGYRTWQWLGPEYPTLIYHHGSGERPFDFGRFSSNAFRRLFVGADATLPANLVAVRAPFHDGTNMEYVSAMGELRNFVGFLAASLLP